MSAERKIVIIAGPNGAGKTTFAREFLPQEAHRSGIQMSTSKRPMLTDPDLLGSMHAMKRAAQRALALAEATGTACLVMQDGKLIDIARKPVTQADKT